MSDAVTVIQTESNYRASDGAHLHGYRWSSRVTDASSKAVVVMMHGYGEHCGRYRELAEYLVRAGYSACGFDARGHGQSPSQRGHIAPYDRYVEDLQGYLIEQRRAYPNQPQLLLGHSNGGLISLRTVQTRQPLPDGLIVSSPLVELQPKHRPLPLWAAKILRKLASRLPLPAGLQREELTHDARIIEAHKRDPLNHNWTTPGWYAGALGAMPAVFAAASSIRMPVLAIEGENDPIVVPAAITRLFGHLGSSDKELLVVPQALHEVLNEIGRVETYRRIVTWLDQRWAKRSAA